MSGTGRRLCALAELNTTGAKEIVLTRDGGRYPVFVVKTTDGVRAYENSCPHARLPLNARPDGFFDVTRSFLFCANHGAHFNPVTGECLRGPCKGEWLKAFPIAVAGDMVVIDDGADR